MTKICLGCEKTVEEGVTFVLGPVDVYMCVACGRNLRDNLIKALGERPKTKIEEAGPYTGMSGTSMRGTYSSDLPKAFGLPFMYTMTEQDAESLKQLWEAAIKSSEPEETSYRGMNRRVCSWYRDKTWAMEKAIEKVFAGKDVLFILPRAQHQAMFNLQFKNFTDSHNIDCTITASRIVFGKNLGTAFIALKSGNIEGIRVDTIYEFEM